MKAHLLAILATSLIVVPALSAQSESEAAAVDYSGFISLAGEVDPYRQSRLINAQTFMEMAEDADTVILDTRSKEAFEAGHIAGALHLNFSDFTDEKLKKVIADKSTRILIYCNNNFTDDVNPVPLKRIELALNIPTFINLYGYGYRNIYELNESLPLDDPRVPFVVSPG